MGNVFQRMTDISDFQLVSNAVSILPVVILCLRASSLVKDELYECDLMSNSSLYVLSVEEMVEIAALSTIESYSASLVPVDGGDFTKYPKEV